jgi:hypothetical protein
MKIPSRLLFCSLIVSALSSPAWAITNGEIDEDNRYANVGALVMLRDPASGPPIVFCSGTLVHERILLTAAHCIDFVDARLAEGHTLEDDFRVSFGVNAREPDTWRKIAAVFVHPDYNHYEGQDGKANPVDLAVVILEDPVEDIAPAVLPTAGLLDDLHLTGLLESDLEGGSPLTAVGYGRTLEFPPPELIRIDGYRRFVETEYLGLTPTYLMVLKNPATDNGGSANGDSGGPIFWTDPLTEQDILVGVHLWSDAERVALTVDYRTDIPETLEFIETFIEMVNDGLL